MSDEEQMTERKAGSSRLVYNKETRTIDAVRTGSATRDNRLAEKLLQIAARRSVESPLGWSHPDCEALEQAARILRGEPEVVTDNDRVGAVLSD